MINGLKKHKLMKLHTEKAIEPFKNQSTKCIQIHCLPCFNNLTIAQPKKLVHQVLYQKVVMGH